jgi:histidyl-tRNA synthetase
MTNQRGRFMRYQTVKGTHDILPEEVSRWRAVEELVRRMMAAYHYGEIRTPVFEHTELFSRSIGQDTDIVGKEMYTFEDAGGRSLTLSPEGTAPVVRSYIEHSLGAKSPQVKLFYIAPMFRQENPQKGRYRQFHQFGMEALGAADAAQDVEIIALAMGIYRRLGLSELSLRLNSVGCRDCRPGYRDVLRGFLEERLDGLCADCRQRTRSNPLRVLDCKRENCKAQTRDAPLMSDHLCDECGRHFTRVRGLLEELDLPYDLDGRLVRGLDYYTRTAFEVISGQLGAQDALGGGGRYDDLVEMLGGPPTPAVGFAAGMERLLMVLADRNLIAPQPDTIDLFAVLLGAGAQQAGLKVIEGLRRRGIRAETDFLDRSLKAQMRAANRLGAPYAIIIGEQELSNKRLILKDMKEGQQEEMDLDEAVERICRTLRPAAPEGGSSLES